MAGMLKELNITLEGRYHSRIDDARNVAKIVLYLLANGFSFTSVDLSKNKIKNKFNIY
jgi:inhibitor of KinA sporulation pathway (predicted exonuclease)